MICVEVLGNKVQKTNHVLNDLNSKMQHHMVEIVRIYEAQRPEPSVSLKHLIKASYINEELQNEAKFTGSVP